MPEEGAGLPRGGRLAEVVAALCTATDMGTGKQPGRGLRIGLLALRIAELMGLSQPERTCIYYAVPLVMLGCTAESSTGASIFGDELAFGAAFAPLVSAPRSEMMGWLVRNYAADERFARRLRRLVRLMTAGRAFFEQSNASHCEVAQRLTTRLGIDEAVLEPLGAVFERWDGSGGPRRLRGEQIPVAVRIGHVAWDVDTFGADAGSAAWTAMLRRRAGRTLDPVVVDAALRGEAELDEVLHVASPWDALLAVEPGTPRTVGDVDAVASVIADFVDLKSDYFAGHSRAVAAIASAAAAGLGMDSRRVDVVRRAGLVHDLGRVAVSSSVWDKPGPLTDAEWETVRLHAYHGERILCRTAVLGDAAAMAGMHHERCDGSGYHRGATAGQLAIEARVLAAADTFAAITEARAHRPARTAQDAARELSEEVRRGRQDGDAVAAVVAAAGEEPAAPVRAPLPAGLSDREADVLSLLARGLATKQIAAHLGISPKTADHHVQNSYRKMGVATRAGATVFAMEHGLLARRG
jgi:HD-GYP domain-containing protein (c-di-GMP phosphodiesterase class II)